jgi:hypothetical protein
VPALRRPEFFNQVAETARTRLPDDLSGFRARSTMNLLKLQYGANYRIHYELAIMTEVGLFELGLHFEDGPESTARLLAFFDQFIVEIKDLLGTSVELERWTKSWGHLYETHPLEALTAERATQLGERMAQVILTLQPLLEEAYRLGLVSREPRPGTGGRFGRRAR